MTKKGQGIDGFVPRRSPQEDARPIGDVSSIGKRQSVERPRLGEVDAARMMTSTSKKSVSLGDISKQDIDASLSAIDTPEDSKKKKGRKKGKVSSRRRRIIKWVLIALLVVILGIGGWLAYKAYTASNSIFKGSILGLVQNEPLKEDENGRSNILILGTSEDDPGHGGAYLTDSMMIMSIHQESKLVDMFSIPRDLYVEYGMACNSGYEGKINEYFNCVNSDWESEAAEEERLTKTREFVGNIFGLDVQYAVHVNNTVIKEAVDAVGGVDVDIQGSNGDPGVLDRNFDWRCNYECYFVKYDNGVHHLDGEHALFLAMARGDIAPTYGLGNSNFDREKNQQKIIIALKEKAVSTGTLSDVGKITGLIDALGKNLRTNFETKEIRTLMEVASKVDSKNIVTISLFDGDAPLVGTGEYGGASVVIPTAGVFNYSQIQAYLQKQLSSNPVAREEPKVAVYNGSEEAGLASTEASALEEKGFTVLAQENAPEGTYEAVEIYQIKEGKTASKAALEELYGVTIKEGTPPVTVVGEADFVVIFGAPRNTGE